MYKNKRKILLGLIVFSLIFHLVGCFYLYDFTNDEGLWLINAKNKVFFNTFSLEGVYHTALSPLNTFLHVFAFKLFWPDIFLGRYISILFALISLALFFLFVNEHYSLKIASFATFVIAVNAIYNRITTFAYLEPKVYFFEILTLFFCFSPKKWVRRLSFLPFCVCLGFKPNIIYFAIPLLYALSAEFKDEANQTLQLHRKINTDIVVFLLSSFLVTSVLFYLAYLMDPLHFVNWGFKTHVSGRFQILSVLGDPLKNSEFPPTLHYIFVHAPVTCLGFIWGIISIMRDSRKTPIDKFLLLWIFSGFCFYAFQTYINERYLLDFMFPLSIFFAKAIYRVSSGENVFSKFRSYLRILIIILIFVIQIGGTLYFFLIVKPGRPAIEVSRWLQKESAHYETILAPAQVVIGLSKKSLLSSNHFTIKDLLLNKEAKPPFLCILQKEAAIIHPEDDIFLRDNGRLINKIGYFWIYELLK